MSRIFISHSSRNDDWAIALNDWLVREGWALRRFGRHKLAYVSRRWGLRR
ncbi:MAG: hypothetical protein WCF20_15320 [Methylovirgula sp.]